jgi:hypothetical protein
MLNDCLEVNEHGYIQDLKIRMRGGLGTSSLIKYIFDWSKKIELSHTKYISVKLHKPETVTKIAFTLGHLRRGSEAIRDVVDYTIFDYLVNEYKGFTYGTADNPVKLTNSTLRTYIKDLYNFAKAFTGSNSLVLVVSPSVKKLLLSNFKDFEIFNKRALTPVQNGRIGTLLGFDVYCSTNLYTRNNTTCMFAISKDFLTYGDDLQVLDQLRDEYFTTIIAKYIYGHRIDNPHGCVKLFVEV